MGILDGMNIAEGAMQVHSYRSEIAAQNIANIHTAGYKRQVVDLEANNFSTALHDASHQGGGVPAPDGSIDAHTGAVRVAGVRHASNGAGGERQDQLMDTTDMLQAKSAYELSVRVATLLKGMATASLEIGRGN